MRSIGVLVVLALALTLLGQGGAPIANASGKKLGMLTRIEAAQLSAKKAFLAKPKDAKLKKAYIDASLKAGNAFMHTDALPPRTKYPKSLKFYREVRKVDPKNAEAIKNIKLMEDIYKSMGRPIPPG